MSKWFTFIQNNSFGVFQIDRKGGIAEVVIIEANDRDHAIERADDIGIYFEGCARGLDCPCCGDRWDEPECYDEPKVYDEPVRTYSRFFKWTNLPLAIHHMDGRIEFPELKEET